MMSNFFLKEDPDIITINSHSITNPDKNVKLVNYSAVTKNKHMDSGVAILIKKDILHTFHTDTSNNNILAASVQTKHGKIKIITFYRPPRQKDLPLMDLNNLTDHNIPTLILADANCKHTDFGHNSNDSNGKLLKSFMNSTDIHYIGPDFFTFHDNNRTGKPDIFLANSKFLTMAYHIQEGERLPCSDHIPIIINASTSPLLIPSPPQFNYNRADWPEFVKHMDELEIPNIINMSTDDIDTNWETLCNHIIQGAENNIPKKSYKLIPSFTQSTKTKKLLQIYNNRHNIYKHNLTPQKIQILNNIKHHINSSAAEDTCNFWSKKMDQLEELKAAKDPKNFFKIIQNLKGKKNYNMGTFLSHNNKHIYDPKEQANALAQTWGTNNEPK